LRYPTYLYGKPTIEAVNHRTIRIPHSKLIKKTAVEAVEVVVQVQPEAPIQITRRARYAYNYS
jgi:hypothetical protein